MVFFELAAHADGIDDVLSRLPGEGGEDVREDDADHLGRARANVMPCGARLCSDEGEGAGS